MELKKGGEKTIWQENMVKDLWARIIKSFLDVLILETLKKESSKPYKIQRGIQEKFGILISIGTIHGHFNFLLQNGLIKFEEEQGWSATKLGVDVFNKLLSQRHEVKEYLKIMLNENH